MVRCFIGIMVPPELRKAIEELQSALRELPMRCKFVEPENLHLNLSFLGEIDQNAVEETKKKLDMIAKEHQSFDLAIRGLLTIPSERYFRVLALNVGDGRASLEELRKEVVKRIGGRSHPPHLTLCRVKVVIKREEVLKGLEKMREVEVGKLTISAIALIQSTLTKRGPTYQILHQSRLL